MINKPIILEKKDPVELLTVAFHNFNRATQSLRQNYQALKKEAESLNKKLAETNEELTRKVRELGSIRNYLNNILDSMTNGLIAIDHGGKITIFNRAAETITTYRAKQVVGLSYEKVFGQKNRSLTSLIKKSLREGISLMEEGVFYRREESIPLEIITNSVRDEKKRMEGVLMVFQDLSTIRRLQKEIEEKKRLALLGEMAANVAHEIRNPLSGIEGFALLLKRTFSGDKKRQEWTDNIIKGARNLNSLVSRLLDFARPLRLNLQVVELKEIIENALFFLSQRIREEKVDIEIKTEFLSHPIKVRGDPNLLKQAFLNLMLNAVQALSEKGKLIIRTNRVFSLSQGKEFVGETRANYSSSRSQREAEVIFSDTGCGILLEDREKIFHPFYTTKAKGCGLGLAITQRIIRSHGGNIRVESKKGKGSIFTVCLPLDGTEG